MFLSITQLELHNYTFSWSEAFQIYLFDILLFSSSNIIAFIDHNRLRLFLPESYVFSPLSIIPIS